MKPKKENRNRNEINTIASALVDDLNAVRSVVLNKQRDLSPEEHASLERRLFESWVIEKLAEAQGEFAAVTGQFEELKQQIELFTKQYKEELGLARKEFKEELGLLRKELKEAQKIAAKLEKKFKK